ncbi:MAG: hypothetical protein U1F34_08210, partial [Gammaproteobacteria bacterium]
MNHRRLFAVVALILWCAISWAGQPAAQPNNPPAGKVDTFSPQGTVKGVRQVAVRFTEQMVPFGDPRLVEPFDIDCPATGKARWADRRNWVYDFDGDLPAGVRCTFTLKKDLKTLAGAAVSGDATYTFSTGGPAIMQQMPYEGTVTLDEEQMFILGLDAPATRESIEKSVYCDIKGVSEKVGVKIIDGDMRKQVLAQRSDFLQEYFRVLTKDGEGHIDVFTLAAPLTGTDHEKFLKLKDGEESPIVVLQCQRRFPPNTDISLVWGKGVTSTSGIATEEDQTLAYHSREEFRANFSCERVNKDAQCNPVLPMSLGFTAPIARADAEKITLKPEKGDPIKPTFSDDKEETVTSVGFIGPFPERTKFSLEIPADLKDDSGRALVNQDRFPLATATDEAPPLIKFPADFGIVEMSSEAALPVTMRNLEAIVPLPKLNATSNQPTDSPVDNAAAKSIAEEPWYARWYHAFRDKYWPEAGEINGRTLRLDDPAAAYQWMEKIKSSQRASGYYDYDNDKYIIEQYPGGNSLFGVNDKTETFTLPKPNGKRAFEVIGVPFKKPGFYLVEIASPRLGGALYGVDRPYHAQTSVLVTNMSAHFKHGRESSLVWVTTLDKAQPVDGATVTVGDCTGSKYFEGTTDKDGLLRIEETLPDLPIDCPGYLVSARAGEDMTFMLSSWNEGISTWRFDLPS